LFFACLPVGRFLFLFLLKDSFLSPKESRIFDGRYTYFRRPSKVGIPVYHVKILSWKKKNGRFTPETPAVLAKLAQP